MSHLVMGLQAQLSLSSFVIRNNVNWTDDCETVIVVETNKSFYVIWIETDAKGADMVGFYTGDKETAEILPSMKMGMVNCLDELARVLRELHKDVL